MNNTISPLISIITVVYNSEKTIKDTLNSVLSQTYKNLEYIIIDGLSSDNTLEIVHGYANKFSQKGIIFTVISEKDNGIYDAMNKGVLRAKGEWIGIINSDDYYTNEAVNQIIETLYKFPSSELIYGNMCIINESIGSITQIKPPSDISNMRNTMSIFHPTVFVKKEVYIKYGRYDLNYKLSADWDLLKRFYLQNIKFQYADTLIAYFRKGGAGSGFKWIHFKERLRIRHKSLDFYFWWYDLKDILIWLHYIIFPRKSLF